MNVEVITFQDWKGLKLDKDDVVTTVSISKDWGRGLSPFFLGPCNLYNGFIAKNVENAWQFCKVYECHLDSDGNINDSYWLWAKDGWASTKAHRYPMGKGAKAKFSYWNGEKLTYVEARKKIYIPVYYNAVKNTESFKRLQEEYQKHKESDKDLYLVDFDAYRHRQYGMTYRQVINDPNRKMGHAFVLAMALEIPLQLEKAIRGNNE